MSLGLVCPNGHPVSVNILAPAGGRFYCEVCGWKDDVEPPQPVSPKTEDRDRDAESPAN